MTTKRREVGDVVWLKRGAGFTLNSHTQPVTIVDGTPKPWCPVCDDPACREWPEVRRPNGDALYHISECEMFDSARSEQ